MKVAETAEILLKNQIDTTQLPEHIAIIMDGNGRWAKSKGKLRVFGHTNGVKSVRAVTEACAELGVNYLTLYAFSSENWNRPRAEVAALMELLVHTIRKELKTLQDNNIKLNAIGHLDNLPKKCKQELEEAIKLTKDNSRMTLTLALSYGSRNEMVDTVKSIAEDIKNGSLSIDSINDELINSRLYTHNLPDPELLIRTSGEQRISNFMLWQMAYTELYFTSTFWPDFQREELYKAILAFQNRERRFGKTSEQVKA
ncbi:MAG: isoprenyl transferase [Chitinophagales bacterium]